MYDPNAIQPASRPAPVPTAPAEEAIAAVGAGCDFVVAQGGVRVGTRFVAATEAAVYPEYVAALIAAEAQDTTLTEAFSNGWPNAPHRVPRSSITAAEPFAATPSAKSVAWRGSASNSSLPSHGS